MIHVTFNIGQRVFVASTTVENHPETCKDCLGSGLWDVHTPSGETLDVRCLTCSYNDIRGWVNQRRWAPQVKERTIGSVQINTHRSEIRYMMEETGVGSGMLYPEENVFTDLDSAWARARALTDEQQTVAVLTAKEQLDKHHGRVNTRFHQWSMSDLRDQFKVACDAGLTVEQLWTALTGKKLRKAASK